jgi:ribose/xylose/arabinose/galactoside ABC-type transport system permease subunit
MLKENTKNIKFSDFSNLIIKRILNNIVWFIVLFFAIILSIINENFLSIANFRNLLIQCVIMGILVLGESFCLLVGYFDLTIEATMLFSIIFSAWLMVGTSKLRSGLDLPPSICIIIGLLLGVFIGFLQYLFIIKIKMNPFIASLGVQMTVLGFAILWLKGGSIYPLASQYRFLGDKEIGIIPYSVILLIVLYLIVNYLLNNTTFGRSVYAVGGNPTAARASGINFGRTIMICFMVSGFFAAVAGWVLAGRMNSASPLLSSGILFNVFAAAVIGGISLSGGRGNVLGAFGGVLLLVLINNALNLMNVNPYWVQVARGLVIIFALFIDSIKSRKT